jgi:hypothetical protein
MRFAVFRFFGFGADFGAVLRLPVVARSRRRRLRRTRRAVPKSGVPLVARRFATGAPARCGIRVNESDTGRANRHGLSSVQAAIR